MKVDPDVVFCFLHHDHHTQSLALLSSYNLTDTFDRRARPEQANARHLELTCSVDAIVDAIHRQSPSVTMKAYWLAKEKGCFPFSSLYTFGAGPAKAFRWTPIVSGAEGSFGAWGL